MDFYKINDNTKSKRNFSSLTDNKDIALHLNEFEAVLHKILENQTDEEQLERYLANVIEYLQYKHIEYIEIFNENDGLLILVHIIQDFPILIEDYIIHIIELLLEISDEDTIDNFINNQIIIEAIIDNFHIPSSLHCMLILLSKSTQIPSFIFDNLSFDLLFQCFGENREFIEDYSNEIVPSLIITCVLLKHLKIELNDSNLEILIFLLNSISEIGFDIICDDEMIQFLESIDFIIKIIPNLIYNISDSFYDGILQLEQKLKYKTYVYSILIDLYNQDLIFQPNDQSFSHHIYEKLDLFSITSFVFHQNNLGKSNFAFSLAIDVLSIYYSLNNNEIGSEFSHELFQHLIEFFILSQFTNRKILLRMIEKMVNLPDSLIVYLTEEFVSILIEMLDPSFEESKIPLRILLIVSENVNLGKPTAISKDFLLESDLVDFLVNELDTENDEQERVVQTILNNLGIDND